MLEAIVSSQLDPLEPLETSRIEESTLNLWELAQAG